MTIPELKAQPTRIATLSSRKGKWQKFREEVISLDGYKCLRCRRTREQGAVLHVHHKEYLPGRDYWDNPFDLCDTLCAGCHAKTHGIISPDFGWQYQSHDDLGGLVGTCDYCKHDLRHSHHVTHPNWGSMDVGKNCCDLLTGTEEASRRVDDLEKRNGRRQRFIQSQKWRIADDGARLIELDGYRIRIVRELDAYRISHIGQRKGKSLYTTLDDAKAASFDAVEKIKARRGY